MLQYKIIPVTPFEQNCTLFWCDETMEGAVIDPGGDVDKILAAITQAKFKVSKVLLTHAHLDHAGATDAISKHFSVEVEGPQKEDQFWIDLIPVQKQQMGFTEGESFKPDRWLEQGDTVEFGNIELEVYYCPGHTPGHIVFFHRDSKLAQVGDVIFKGSIGRCDFPRGNQAQLIHSIRENLFPLGNEVQFIPGHGPMSTFGAERQSNPYVADNVVGR